jgi:predicted lactoylglutathione lyase
MDQRVTLITLGVADLARARAFYESVGWKVSSASQCDVVFFQMNGAALALWPRSELAKDAGLADSKPGFSGVALAQNLRSPAEVDAVYAQIIGAGARPLKPPQATFWGGYSAYAADPEGHVWEIAHNPFFPLDAAGGLHLPDDAA